VASIPAGQKCLLLHQVGPGENLHILAAYYYGNARAWRQIYNLNKKSIKNPNRIRAGQIIKIEVAPCWTPRFDLQEFMRLEQRRAELIRRPGQKIREYRTTEVIDTKITVIIEEGAEVEEEEVEVELPGLVPGPRVEIPAPPAETAPPAEGGGE
jgi:hypothetical protein